MVHLCRVIFTEARGCMFLLQNLSHRWPVRCTTVRYKELYSNSWEIPLTVRLYSRQIRESVVHKWDEYSNQVFSEFLDKLDETNFDREKEFINLEEELNKYETKKSNTDFQIINLMVRYRKPQLVLDYIDFIRRKGDISPFSLLRAIDGVVRLYPDIGLSWIREFLLKVPFEHQTRFVTNRVITALLYTKDYKLAIEQMEKNVSKQYRDLTFLEQSVASNLPWKALLCTVLHQDTDEFSSLTRKYNIYFLRINQAFYEDCLAHIKSGVLPPDVFLEVLKHFFIGPSLPQLKMAVKEFGKYWGDSVCMEYVQLSNKSCRCPACGEELQHVHFTTEDIKSLGERVAQAILKSSRVSLKMERELSDLEMYLNRYGPFDVVVDTLNLTDGKPSHLNDLMEQIHKYVGTALRRPQPKILFISKLRHRGSWRHQPKDCFQYTLNIKGSNDDLLVMLAALKSGPDTYFISNDLYSDHLRNADPETFYAVMQWKQARKITFNARLKTDLPVGVSFSMPFPFESVTQESDNAWHVPYHIPGGLSEHQASLTNIDRDKFLCIQKKENWQPSSVYTKMFMNNQSKYKVKKSVK